nr:MAG TPA: hypothetical protein [Caudoviricetes sp.]
MKGGVSSKKRKCPMLFTVYIVTLIYIVLRTHVFTFPQAS